MAWWKSVFGDHAARAFVPAFAILGASAAALANPGDIDPTFAASGTYIVRETGTFGSVSITPAGKIAVGRSSTCPVGMSGSACVIVTRLLGDGRPDPSFGAQGEAAAPVPGFPREGPKPLVRLLASDMALFLSRTGDTGFQVRRLTASGGIDAGFANPTLPAASDPFNAGSALLEAYPDGRFVFASPRQLARYLEDGRIDPGFNGGTPIEVGSQMHWHRVATLASGGLVIAGIATNANRPVLHKRGADGSLDAAFGNGGVREITVGAYSTRIDAMALLSDGRILLAGGSANEASTPFTPFVMRLAPDGANDTTFGDSGLGIVMLPGTAASFGLSGVAVQADGRIVVANTEMTTLSGQTAYRGVLVRLTANGMPDATFGSGGIATVDPTSGSDLFLAVEAHPDGGIVLAGSVDGTAGQQNSGPAEGVYGVTKVLGATLAPSALVASYYRSILERDPEPAGLDFWQREIERTSALGASVSDAFYALAAQFFGSDEYRARNPSDGQFVSHLYRTFFFREPDAPGLAFWTSELANGKPRGAVLNDFMFSAEFSRFMARMFGAAAASRVEVSMVMDFYRGLLARLPDSEGFNFWLRRFRSAQCSGTVREEADTISALFVGSGEYASRQGSLPAAERTSAYVIDLYNAFLKRGGDRAGLQFWVDQIDSGARTREEVRREFVGSGEFDARVRAVIAQGCS